MNTTLSRAVWFAKRRIRSVAPMPSSFYRCYPIAQLFLNTHTQKTTFTFINFPSLFDPKDALSCRYQISIFDSDGKFLSSTTLTIPPYGTRAIRIDELFPQPLPDFGMITAQIRAGSGIRYPYAHLGDLTSHFYAIYHDDKMQTVALVHPQTPFAVEPLPEATFQSDVLIDPTLLDAIDIYQINPSQKSVPTTIHLKAMGGQILEECSAILAPRASRRVRFSMKTHQDAGLVFMSVHGLTGPNAKPLIFNIFSDDAFTACHS